MTGIGKYKAMGEVFCAQYSCMAIFWRGVVLVLDGTETDDITSHYLSTRSDKGSWQRVL